MRYFTLFLICMGLTSCAKQYVKLPTNLLNPPTMEQVSVESLEGVKQIIGPNVDNVITNHVNLWEYVEYLLAKQGYKAIKGSTGHLRIVPRGRSAGNKYR